jgi:hypothetical protein
MKIQYNKRFSILVITILIMINIPVYCQDKCNCDALINYNFIELIPVFDNVDGTIMSSISNDSINEDYLLLTILDVQKEYFKVSIRSTNSEKILNGWIKKAAYIGTYARNYVENETLMLYSYPDKNSNVESVVDFWIPDLYSITDCNGTWVKVRITYMGKTYSGWLEKNMQCANPFTTCN